MSDEEDFSLWEQQRIFRTGIKKKKIDFVAAAAAPTQSIQSAPQTTASISAGDRYLHIVLKNGASTGDYSSTSTGTTQQQFDLKRALCETCNLPINALGDATSTAPTNHESMIAHMVCLTHSHPPSHLDRNHQGLKYLSSYGWDPDSRQGLGATGEGIRAPIKAKVKNDTVGLGVKMKVDKKTPDAKVERMDAKQVRKKDMEDRRKRERLQEMFYGNDDVEKHLGGELYGLKNFHACPRSRAFFQINRQAVRCQYSLL
ncbi:MAG: hypothetical protein Q9175_003337 [Cornicularia normoerica]